MKIKNNTYYTLTVDGTEMAKSKLLSGVALKPNEVNPKTKYEIAKHVDSKVVRTWGYIVDPETGEKQTFTTFNGKPFRHMGSKPIPSSMIQPIKKTICLGKRLVNAVSTLKREYKVRKNLKLIEKKVHLFDL
tara:strand:+ start:7222 stop:7617 length:396 start_codon:yes stop_codon:yes gene_type:complete